MATSTDHSEEDLCTPPVAIYINYNCVYPGSIASSLSLSKRSLENSKFERLFVSLVPNPAKENKSIYTVSLQNYFE
jgi:hypothetical protein